MRRKRAGTFKLIEELSLKAEGDMKLAAPWKDQTAIARGSLHSGAEQVGKDKIRMYFAHGVRYGGILEEGTPPHKIRARNKPYLQFRVGGRFVKVKEVNHPGTKPRAIVQPTAKSYKGKLKDTLVKWWSMP